MAEEDASLGAEKGARDSWGSRNYGRGGGGRGSNSAVQRGRVCASRSSKGCTFLPLQNVIETTIKYERATMNAPNNSELFASSMPRPENEGGFASTLSREGRAKI